MPFLKLQEILCVLAVFPLLLPIVLILEILTILNAIGSVGNTESIALLEKISLQNTENMEVRQNAAEKIGKSRAGEDRALELLRSKKAPVELIPYFVAGLKESRRKAVVDESLTFLPESIKNIKQKQSIAWNELLPLTGNTKNGAAVSCLQSPRSVP